MRAGREAGSDDLDRLAALAGIEPSHRDYYGRETLVSRETKRALLRALGFAGESPEEAAASLAALDAKPWRRTIEPAVVVTLPARRIRVPVTLPAADAARTITWQLVEESARAHAGSVRFDALALSAARAVDGRTFERRTLELAVALPAGYHRLAVDGAETSLIVAPPRCYLPRTIARGAKVWGIAVQLYGLRSRRNWGIGDFGDLRALARAADRAGAAAIGLNPLHELDPANPDACSPYSPSSRLWLNVAYLDVEAIPDFSESDEARRLVASEGFSRAVAVVRDEPLVDYSGAAASKRQVLALLYAWFRRVHVGGDTARARAFRAFVGEGGRSLSRLATFEALRERFAATRPHELGWANWPVELRDPSSHAVAQFAEQRRERVEFFAYLQWNADLQLAAAARACGRMPIGLYRDLAVGAEPSGAEAWSDQNALLPGVAIGAPPDSLNEQGQNWGLAPLSPLELRERGYAPFAELVRANMRHAGALRIDHAMSLQRLFWIPHGHPARDGAYVRFPFEDLLAILALESERNKCLVVGEDLGTVPEGFRDRLQRARAFSSRLLYHEREPDGAYRIPEVYPALALASPGTHDLPTLPAFWLGHDLAMRAQLGLLPPAESLDDARLGRTHERGLLLDALVAGGDLAAEAAGNLRAAGDSADRAVVALAVRAAYRYLARSGARLLMVPLEDALDVVEQTNVPGTTWEHPNWRRRLAVPVEDLALDPRFAEFANTLRTFRARSGTRPARSSPEPR